MFKNKFPTERIFLIFPILRINGMASFCNLFMERPSYFRICKPHRYSLLTVLVFSLNCAEVHASGSSNTKLW